MATLSFGLLVVMALGYVLWPLMASPARTERSCEGCGRELAEGDNYCIACGRAANGRGEQGIIQPGDT